MKKWLIRILIGAAALVLLALAGAWIWLRSSAPGYRGERALEGLRDKVTVTFDEAGIPHIAASDRHDLYLAFGYLHARERLFQMELLRRAGNARLAEVLGPDLLPVDRLFTTLGLPDYAEASAIRLSALPDTALLADVEAYLSGINRFLETGPSPPEFSLIGIPKQPFSTRDLFAIMGAMAYNFSQAQKTDFVMDDVLRRFGPGYLDDLAVWHDSTETFIPDFRPAASAPATGQSLAEALSRVEDLLPFAPMNGSNAWVLSGERTASGSVIFCNDTHIGYLVPQTWYEAVLSAPGFQLHGHFLAGIPFALVGTTPDLSWGLTMLLNDDMDFYRETLDTTETQRVMYGGTWTAVVRTEYRIPVKGADSATVVVRRTPHGPLVNDVIQGMDTLPPVSMSWVYTQLPNDNLRALYGLNHATDMEGFQGNLPMIHAPGLSINYGDRAGNVAWWSCAHLLRRPAHTLSLALLDGASGKDEPLGYYDFARNPRCINPPSGYVYSANDWPQAIDTTGAADGGLDYWYPGYYKPQWRADRINQLLRQRSDWTPERLEAVMNDVVNTQDSTLYALLWAIAANKGGAPASTLEGFQELRNWNGGYLRTQAEPTLYNRWLYHTMRLACQDEMGAGGFRLFAGSHQFQRACGKLLTCGDSPWWDNTASAGQREWRGETVAAALALAVNELRRGYGPDPVHWTWGRSTTLEFQHPLSKVPALRPLFNIGPFPVDGGNETIRQAGFTHDSLPANRVFFGSQMRIIWDYATGTGRNITPCGQSGHPLSPHYRDQSERYSAGEFRSMRLGAAGTHTLVLVPG